MPRGKRKTSREKLEELRETIASQEAQLKELRQREKELLKQQKEEELRRLCGSWVDSLEQLPPELEARLFSGT